MTCILDLSLSTNSEWQPEEFSHKHSLPQTSWLGFSLSLASVLGVLGGCSGCQKCQWLCSLHLHCSPRELNWRSGHQTGFLASCPALPFALGGWRHLDYSCSLCSLLSEEACLGSREDSTLAPAYLLEVRWDRRESLKRWKALFKINWVDETPKRMKLFAWHDESFNISIITLTCKNQVCFLPHNERLVLNILWNFRLIFDSERTFLKHIIELDSWINKLKVIFVCVSCST